MRVESLLLVMSLAWESGAARETDAAAMMARVAAFAVRTLLGTSVPGPGFTVIFAPQAVPAQQPVWFPVSFGTEFHLNVLFFLRRELR